MNKLKIVFPNRKLIFPTYESKREKLDAPKGGFIESGRVDTVKIAKEQKSSKK